MNTFVHIDKGVRIDDFQVTVIQSEKSFEEYIKEHLPENKEDMSSIELFREEQSHVKYHMDKITQTEDTLIAPYRMRHINPRFDDEERVFYIKKV